LPSDDAGGAVKLVGRRGECQVLDQLLADVLAGASRVLVLRGEAGVGKSALLGYLTSRATGWRLVRAVGVESEMELAYSGLHQLCVPMLDSLERLPSPQAEALATVFGRSAGPAPDRFLVGLATLTLLAEVAEEQPLLCIVDDAQWLDQASAQIIGFVARRLAAERIAIVSAARTDVGEDVLAGLHELSIEGLDYSDARELLLRTMQGTLDAAVAEQIIAESHGNPLALLELPSTLRRTDLAGGFGLPESRPVVGRIEQSYARRLQALPSDTRLLVLAAAAEPLGDPALLQRATATLGVDMESADPAVDAGLVEVVGRVEFAHPLARSAAYRIATSEERHRVHRALAEATDPERDPDRRAWHRARATLAPDEEVAFELECSAGRAQTRGGVAAAAAFLERAAALSPDHAKRARRALAAAEAKQLAGAPEAAMALLAVAVDGPLDELESALAQRLKGEISLDLRRGAEAIPPLLDAARRLESLDPELARETYLEAIRAGNDWWDRTNPGIGGHLGGQMLRRVAEAARNAPLPAESAHGRDLLLAGLAARFTDGCAASAPLLKRALLALCDEDKRGDQDVRWPGVARRVALDLFDDETWHVFGARSVQRARERGALGALPLALNYLAMLQSFEGELSAAEAVLDESDAIADAIGGWRFLFGRLTLAAFRGDEPAVTRLVEAGEAATLARGGGMVTFGDYARALLHNGLGRYTTALPAAESASARDELGLSTLSLPELVEAASRCGKDEVAAAALDRLTERTQAAGTDWALGIEMRSRALLTEPAVAEDLYREAVDRLRRTRLRPELARAKLVYGEWLRREGRRVDARAELLAAHEIFITTGMEAFAERARIELLATGQTVRKRVVESRGDLTPQEAQIARLARDGLSNPEIGARLFLSARTVEWHLRKVYSKLGIASRRELGTALSERGGQGALLGLGKLLLATW
jgi:DNA-binding CsgD family transcriptional regulator